MEGFCKTYILDEFSTLEKGLKIWTKTRDTLLTTVKKL